MRPAAVLPSLGWQEVPVALLTSCWSNYPTCSIFDLVLLNPNASTLRPGAPLNAPCYPAGTAAEFGYYGGSVAFGQVRLLCLSAGRCMQGI